MTSNAVLWNLSRKWLLLIFCFNFLFLFFDILFSFFSFELYTNEKGTYIFKTYIFKGTIIFKTLQKFFYGCVSPVFWWMVFPNFIRAPPFFFIIILNDEFVFFRKHHCEQIVTKIHCERRGSSLTIYSNVM